MKSLLIFRSAALGDFILATPALHQLRQQFPRRRIVLLTTQTIEKSQRLKVADYAGTAKSVPWVGLTVPHLVDEVLVIEEIYAPTVLWSVRRRLADYDFEAVILMVDPCSPWMGRIKKLLLLKLLVGRVPILGWRSKGSLKGDLPSLKQMGLLRHHVHGPLQFLSELDPSQRYQDDDLVFDLRPGSEAEVWIESWIKTHDLASRRIVVIAPGSIQPHKRWPQKSFAALIEMLLNLYGDLSIVVVGTPKDKELGDSLLRTPHDFVFNLAGITNIAQSAALMSRSTLVVGNDGGAMHLADAMGAKVISLIPGIEYPDSIEPWHNKDLAVRIDIECAPCYSFVNCPQGHQKCMNDIPLESVLDKCKSVLDAKSAAKC